MFPYAYSKILRTQFVVFPSIWQHSLESLPGRSLTWAFFGHSPWLQMLIGFLELIPALLLLFRRTTLLGAILMLPVTLNVFLINYALELWDATKLISSFLLLLNCLVLTFEWKRIYAILKLIFNYSNRLRFKPVEFFLNSIIITYVSYLALTPIIHYRNERNAFTGDWLNHHPIEWILSSERLNDSLIERKSLKIYFGAFGAYEEVANKIFSSYSKYEFDSKLKTLTFFSDYNYTGETYKYQFLGDSALRVERIIDTTNNTKVSRVFTKRIMELSK